jgi:hypothetical protein
MIVGTYDRGRFVGAYVFDFFIDGKNIVALKVVSRLGYTHRKQVLPYLNAAHLD